MFSEDQLGERDAVITSFASGRAHRLNENGVTYLARHSTLPVSPFLLLSEVGSWASSTSITMFFFRDLAPFELFSWLPSEGGRSVNKSSSIFTFRTGVRESM